MPINLMAFIFVFRFFYGNEIDIKDFGPLPPIQPYCAHRTSERAYSTIEIHLIFPADFFRSFLHFIFILIVAFFN